MSYLTFKLSEEFISSYESVEPKWGTSIGGENNLSELIFVSKYSRIKEDGSKEKWFEVCRRCVEGMYSILKDHCSYQRTSWNDAKAQRSAQDAYDRMFNFKWTPPGRGLWTMGSELVHKERNSAPLFNCSFISTGKISAGSVKETIVPFVSLMEMSMYGIGCGFDVRGAEKLEIFKPGLDGVKIHVVEDSREGWAKSVGVLLESFFFKGRAEIGFDYSEIRPAGSPLVRFGGIASGPEPLENLHDSIRSQFEGREGILITSRDIVDIMNKIGKAVVAGGSRRSALIALGEHLDDDYVNLKNWNLEENKERTGPDGWAWLSNNSVYVKSDNDLEGIVDKIAINGEPGVIYLDNMQDYGRMIDEPNYKDTRVLGTNPCGEVSLTHMEFCNLSELYPVNHEDLDDFKKSIKHAYMFTKAVTLMPTPWSETNEVIARNRRIGVSITGITDFIEDRSIQEMTNWMDEGYKYLAEDLDIVYSEWLGVRESIKLTCIKPSGTTSLIASTTAGVHWPTTTGYYIRRVRYSVNDPIVNHLSEAGYDVELDINDPKNTLVVSFPTRGKDMRSEREVSIWEKAHLAVMAQRYWADNQVSVTVSFREEEAKEISPLLNALSGQLKSISFLPITDEGTSYAQAPYEPIDEDTFNKMTSKIKKLGDFYKTGLEAQGEVFCNTDSCELPS